MICDLHCHTKLSDGSLGIEDIIDQAKRVGIDWLSLTDHDTMASFSRADVLGIDEPFKGLSLTEIHSVVSFLKGMIAKGKTIVVIDHNEEAFPYFAKRIELVSDKGILKEN